MWTLAVALALAQDPPAPPPFEPPVWGAPTRFDAAMWFRTAAPSAAALPMNAPGPRRYRVGPIVGVSLGVAGGLALTPLLAAAATAISEPRR